MSDKVISTEGDTSSDDDRDGDSRLNFCSGMLVPPPSPIFHGKQSQTKEETESPKLIRPSLIVPSPPSRRKILQIHRATLDLDPNSDNGEGMTSELPDSDDDSPVGRRSGTRRSQQADGSIRGGAHRCCDKTDMPPELIVTPAQVYEMQSMDFAEKSPSKESKGKEESPSLPGKAENCWSPDRIRSHHSSRMQQRYDFIQDGLSGRLSLQTSLTLRQSIWTSVDYCPECSSPQAWGSQSLIIPPSDDIIQACNQKLNSLKKHKHHDTRKNKEKDRDKSAKRDIVKLKTSKSEPEIDMSQIPPQESLQTSKKRTRRKTTRVKKQQSQSSTIDSTIKNDPNLLIEPVRVEESRKSKELPWKKPPRQPIARTRFRKGGIVATATVRTFTDQEAAEDSDDEDEKTNVNGGKKKKKKRKFLNLHKKVRKVLSATVTAVTASTSNEGCKSGKNR
ncbi:hypothetical protein LSTR_LSTR001223 [Laodelphax striatellus]|uniref:Uncharacterized protein n=1 Tax=Laodelphax striatellus TaxID=195883 RepID=A0A482XAP8_LAOST|nr:hypothetical protein LSTR_LSTR001223 [Laodelphax striatellus]